MKWQNVFNVQNQRGGAEQYINTVRPSETGDRDQVAVGHLSFLGRSGCRNLESEG